MQAHNSGTRSLSVTNALCNGSSAFGPPDHITAVNSIKKKLAAHEEKVGVWLDQHDRSNRLREASITRLEEKIALRPTYEKRYAECQGTLKGLSDELQEQVRRIGTNEQHFQDSLQSLKKHLEEQIRESYAALDGRINEISSKQRTFAVSFEELTLKHNESLQKMEEECTASIYKRMELVEAFSGSKPNEGASIKDINDAFAALTVFERHLGDVLDKIGKTEQDSRDTCARITTNEEQLRTLRTLLDRKDDQFRYLCDRLDEAPRGILEKSEAGAVCSAEARVEQCLTQLDECKNRIAQLSSDIRTMNGDGQLARICALVEQLEELKPKFIQHDTHIKDLFAKHDEQSKGMVCKYEEICSKHDHQADKLACITQRLEQIATKEQQGSAKSEGITYNCDEEICCEHHHQDDRLTCVLEQQKQTATEEQSGNAEDTNLSIEEEGSMEKTSITTEQESNADTHSESGAETMLSTEQKGNAE